MSVLYACRPRSRPVLAAGPQAALQEEARPGRLVLAVHVSVPAPAELADERDGGNRWSGRGCARWWGAEVGGWQPGHNTGCLGRHLIYITDKCRLYFYSIFMCVLYKVENELFVCYIRYKGRYFNTSNADNSLAHQLRSTEI